MSSLHRQTKFWTPRISSVGWEGEEKGRDKKGGKREGIRFARKEGRLEGREREEGVGRRGWRDGRAIRGGRDRCRTCGKEGRLQAGKGAVRDVGRRGGPWSHAGLLINLRTHSFVSSLTNVRFLTSY